MKLQARKLELEAITKIHNPHIIDKNVDRWTLAILTEIAVQLAKLRYAIQDKPTET